MSRHNGRIVLAQHVSMPFGAVSSVHAWDRVAKLLCRIARVLLKIPMLVYVDDFHSAEKPETGEHAKLCFARIVRALLGSRAVADAKLEHGNPLIVLGIVFTPTPLGVWCKPSPDKIAKRTELLIENLRCGTMLPGSAKKMAGA